MTDISAMNLQELRALQDQVRVALLAREQEVVSKAREQIIDIAKGVGRSVAEIMAPAKKERQSSGPVAAIYQSKSDPTKKWSGRGRQPKWVKEWVAAGKSLDEVRI